MLRIVTDSASDITLKQAEEMQIEIVPLTIAFEDGICPQETEEDFNMFFERLASSKNLPMTSQPSPESYLKIFEKAKENNEEVVVIALSSGLSGTFQSANIAKDISGYENIYVVDSRQAIMSQRMLVEYAVRLRSEGLDAKGISEKIEKIRDRITVCGLIDTMTYLRKGGRIPGALAVIGNALQIKPVIILRDTILQNLGKTRGRKAGIRMLQEEMEKAGRDPDWPVYFGYTVNRELGMEFMEDTVNRYSLDKYDIFPVGGVIGTHVGPQCLGIAFVAKEKDE